MPETKEPEKEAPVKKLHDHVIERIQASGNVTEEAKKKAAVEITRMKEAGDLNLLDWNKIDLNLGSPLGHLFLFSKSTLGSEFWTAINTAVSW